MTLLDWLLFGVIPVAGGGPLVREVVGKLVGTADDPLWGQAGRQVFLIAGSLYGWWRWSTARRAGGPCEAAAADASRSLP